MASGIRGTTLQRVVREGLGRVVQVEGETRANPGWWDGLPMFQN